MFALFSYHPNRLAKGIIILALPCYLLRYKMRRSRKSALNRLIRFMILRTGLG